MQFIETAEGVLYPVSRIEAIRIEDKPPPHPPVMIRVDGTWHSTFITAQQITLMTSTVIVPTERHSAVVFYPAGKQGPGDVEIIPIVAFALTPQGVVLPIGLEGTDFRTKESIGILRPDGRVEIPGDACFDDIEAFKSYMQARATRWGRLADATASPR